LFVLLLFSMLCAPPAGARQRCSSASRAAG
jgi:hypothetical protein